jgi:hypothetical protein
MSLGFRMMISALVMWSLFRVADYFVPSPDPVFNAMAAIVTAMMVFANAWEGNQS